MSLPARKKSRAVNLVETLILFIFKLDGTSVAITENIQQ